MTQGWIKPTSRKVRRAAQAGDFSFGWNHSGPRRYDSRFGFVEDRVQLDANGEPDFDRMVVGEAPNINAVVWGTTMRGEIRVALVIQGRPLADNPDGTPADPAISFGQCVMGFNVQRVTGEETATREASEEVGAEKRAVISVKSMGYHNPNPTFCATWSELYEVNVDLGLVTDRIDRTELIYRAEYVSVEELLHRVAQGDHDGVSYRSATANDAYFVWLTRNPGVMLEAAHGLIVRSS